MKKFSLLILLMCLTVGVISGCMSDQTIKSGEEDNNLEEVEQNHEELSKLAAENEELQRQIESYEMEAENLQQYIISYQSQIDEMFNLLNEDQKLALAQAYWQYELTVNETNIPDDGVIEIENQEVVISLSQHQSEDTYLPYELIELGRLSGEYFHEHIIQVKPEQDEETWRDGTIVTAYELIFTDLASGSEVEITITDELKERLGLQTDLLIIRIK